MIEITMENGKVIKVELDASAAPGARPRDLRAQLG